MRSLLFLHLSAGLAFSCDDSLLIVGGQDASGPLSSLHLLTSTGWCEDINFPPLPEPVVNPAVHLFSLEGILIVCGFSSDPCMWTEIGASSWYSLQIQQLAKNHPFWENYNGSQTFSIVNLDGRSLVMVTNEEGNNEVGHTYNFNLDSFPYPAWHLAEDQTSDFYLDVKGYRKNFTGSCLTTLGQEIMLIGGRTSYTHDGNSQIKNSDDSVGRMSPDGAVHCSDEYCEPAWEPYVVPDLMQGREDHRCLTTKLEGNDIVMVGGGSKYHYIWGKSGPWDKGEVATYETLRSVELYDGEGWSSGGEFKEARAGFGLAEMCGNVIAMGGRQYDGTYRWDLVYNGPPDCGEPCLEETVTDTLSETFLDSIEVRSFGNWLLNEIKLPQAMANFGVAKATTSICMD